MARALVNRKKYSIQEKSDVYNLIIVDRNLLSDGNRRVDEKTKLLPIAIQQHYKKLIFDIVEIVTHDIVLEISWLKQHNSEVDWSIRELRFKQYNYASSIQSIYRQHSIIDKRQSRDPTARYKFVFLYKNNYNQFNSTDISKSQQNYKVRINKEDSESSENLGISDKARKPLKYILQIYNR